MVVSVLMLLLQAVPIDFVKRIFYLKIVTSLEISPPVS